MSLNTLDAERPFIRLPSDAGDSTISVTSLADAARTRPSSELEDFFENGELALHLVGPDGSILRANKAELKLLGYTADEYIGRHIAEFHADQATIQEILT